MLNDALVFPCCVICCAGAARPQQINTARNLETTRSSSRRACLGMSRTKNRFIFPPIGAWLSRTARNPSTTLAITVLRLGRACNLGPGFSSEFAHRQSDSGESSTPPTCVTRLDRNVIASDISATIFLQPRLLDVSDGVHALCKALVLPIVRAIQPASAAALVWQNQ